MKLILKVTYTTVKGGSRDSKTKHLRLGDTIKLDDDQYIESLTFDDVKLVISESDMDEDE